MTARRVCWRFLLRAAHWAALISVTCTLTVLGHGSAGLSFAQSDPWSTPVKLSEDPQSPWFPDVAVDVRGSVHAIWAATLALPARAGAEQTPVTTYDALFYVDLSDETSSAPNDIAVAPSGRVIRAAVASDGEGKLHLVYRDDAWIYYMQAPAGKAWSAAGWTSPVVISGPDSYLPDIAVDSQGTVHVAWTKGVGICPTCFPVFYRNSTDGGRTWSYPRRISSSPAYRARLQLLIDWRDTLYLVWDDVDDEGEHISSAYALSSDGGQSWSAPRRWVAPGLRSKEAVMGIDARGTAVTAWRTDSDDYIYYQSSSDGGRSWSSPERIEGILARSRDYYAIWFDKYAMATDSSGNLHLLVVGRMSELEDPPGLYHLTWDGDSWSPPALVFSEPDLFPEYPSIGVGEGNTLHVAWFTRDREHFWDTANGTYGIWYSSAVVAVPLLIPTIVPAPSATSPSTETPRTTASPTPHESGSEPSPGSPGDAGDWRPVSMSPLWVAIAPLALLLSGLVLGRTRRRFR